MGVFEEIRDDATPEDRKELMRFFAYKVIFTPAEVKMGLYSRPIFAGQVESTATGNHMGVGAVDRMNWLPECNSMRTRQGRVEPDVYFRFILVVGDSHHGAQVAASRDQTVKIVLPGRLALSSEGDVAAQMASADTETSPFPCHDRESTGRDRGGVGRL